jgi:type I restriction enzyme R subunit
LTTQRGHVPQYNPNRLRKKKCVGGFCLEGLSMTPQNNEAFSRILIDEELKHSKWGLLDARQVKFEYHTQSGRADYLLLDRNGRVLCVLEAKREDKDPYDAKEQARGYAQNLNAPFVMLSNGREHWFWNLQRAQERDAYRIERLPSREDMERQLLKNMQPPNPLLSVNLKTDYLKRFRDDIKLRGYQIRALDAIAKQFDNERRRKFLLEMATGTGKTLLCAALIRLFLETRNAERVLFVVDRIELAKQTMEDFNVVLREYSPVIYKNARKSGELLGSSVVVATIQSLMVGRRYREEFTPFYFDLVVNDEAHRSIYGDSREVVQFFQGTRVGLTATPKAYLRNVDIQQLGAENPKALEARQLRDTYHYFGCEPGNPTYRYDIIDAVQDPEGPFLCRPKIIDIRSEVTTKALEATGWTVTINEQEENYKVQDLERKVFTPARNRVMCEAFFREAQKTPDGKLGKSIIFAVNQKHATELTKILNEMQPESAVTITSHVKDASSIAKDFRDGKRHEPVAVSVDMLSTGYNCRDLLNVVLMRPVFSPTEYIQIKGRGTRRYTFKNGNTEYEKEFFFLLDFCGVAEYFEEQYDYSVPLELPREGRATTGSGGKKAGDDKGKYTGGTGTGGGDNPRPEIPIWQGVDKVASTEVHVVGPDGEKVDVMTFRGAFERDLKDFAQNSPEFQQAVDNEDDDAVETILQEQFFHRPEWYYSPDKLVQSYRVPAPTSGFVYHALGRKLLPTIEKIVGDTIDSIAARFNLRYSEQQWIQALARLVIDDPEARTQFIEDDVTVFTRAQFNSLGGTQALREFTNREDVFEALKNSTIVRQSLSGGLGA